MLRSSASACIPGFIVHALPWLYSFADYERVEDLDPWTSEILVVSSRNGQIVSPRNRCDIAVLNGHGPTSLLQLMLLFGPYMRNRHIEAKNSTAHCVDELSEPRLQGHALFPSLATNPVGESSDDDGACVAIAFFLLEPCDYASVTVFLGRLTQNVGVQ